MSTEINVMNNLNNLPGMDLVSETNQGGFHVDTVDNPNPGFIIMEEVWKDISGLENVKASNMGNIMLNGEIKKSHNSCGYRSISIKGKQFIVHRLIATTFIPNPKNKPEVNHKNGIKTDNRIENLEWVTHEENHIHASINGLTAHGENHYKAKLNEFQVRVIRRCVDITYMELSEIFGVTAPTVYNAKSKINWKHIKSELE